MEQLNKIKEKIDGLSLRERAIVFAGIIFLMFSAWDSFLITPLEQEQKKIISKLNGKNAERLVLFNKFQKLLNDNKKNPDENNLTRLKTLRSQLIDIQANLESSTASLVSPEDMPKLLETVLHKTGGLTLLSLKSLGVTPVVTQEGSESVSTLTDNSIENEQKLTAENIDSAYRHGLRIEISGDYFTTLSYLISLEELEWGFFWDNFNLTVNEYPEANVVIEIFTLSLDKEWIGV